MKTSPKQYVFMILPLVTLVMSGILMSSTAMAQTASDIPWLSNVEQAKQLAAEQNKLVLLHFDASWCRPCKALETFVFRSAAVRKAIAENVIPVKLDADRELSLVNEYSVSMVPFDIIITPGGRVITERRSPADAENFAKMISNTSTASRLLSKEKMGPIAHQRKVVKNQSIAGQNPTDFRVDGPEEVELGLSKDGSLLQRRQTAFSNNNSVKKTNPFVGPQNGALDLAADSGSRNSLAVEDLERDKFLSRSRQRELPVPSMETRRAKPQRIVNDRYFEAVAERQSPNNRVANQNAVTRGSYNLASSAQESGFHPAPAEATPNFDLQLESSPTLATEPASDSVQLAAGNFQLQSTTGSTTNAAAEVATAAPAFDRGAVSLKGKCPVTLVTEGRWADGDAKYGIMHRNRAYVIASAEKLAIFQQDPDKYSPVLAGYDPVVFHEQGKLVEGLVENGIFMGRMPAQKVVLFQDQATRSKFQTAPKLYLETIRQATQKASSTSVMR